MQAIALADGSLACLMHRNRNLRGLKKGNCRGEFDDSDDGDGLVDLVPGVGGCNRIHHGIPHGENPLR